MTTSRRQAENFAKISVKKAAANGTAGADSRYGIVSVFRLNSTENLAVKTFPTTDEEWLHCIVGHRRAKTFSDIVQALDK